MSSRCRVTARSIFNEIDSSGREDVRVKSEEWCQVVGIRIIILKIIFVYNVVHNLVQLYFHNNTFLLLQISTLLARIRSETLFYWVEAK